MDFRKIIQLGNNTSVISLPKRWVDQYKLSKGDALITQIHGNSIIFRTAPQQKSTKKIVTISITKKTPQHAIKRRLISVYENNATQVTFTGQGLHAHSQYITTLVESFIGLEIIEQTPSTIVAKTYISSEEIDVKTFVKRIDTTLRAAVIEFFEFFETKNSLLVDSISQKEINIDKLTLMMKRVIKERLEQFELYKETPASLLHYWDIISNLEKVSDIITTYALEIQHEKNIQPLPGCATKARMIFKKILNNMYGKDVEKANQYGDEIKDLVDDIYADYEQATIFNEKRLLRLILQITELIREINRLSY